MAGNSMSKPLDPVNCEKLFSVILVFHAIPSSVSSKLSKHARIKQRQEPTKIVLGIV